MQPLEAAHHNLVLPSKPCPPMAATAQSVSIQHVPHLTSPVCFARLLMEGAHPLDELLVGLGPSAQPSSLPSIVATPADL